MTSKESFTTSLQESFSLTADEAEHVYAVFSREKVLVHDKHGGGITLVHGAFWDELVIQNALSVPLQEGTA